MAHFRIFKAVSLEQYRRLCEASIPNPTLPTSAPASQYHLSQPSTSSVLTNYPQLPTRLDQFGGQQQPTEEVENPEATALLLGIPEGQRSKAKRLINYIFQNKSLSWKSNGSIEYLGVSVPKSNIIDLISAATSPNKLRRLNLPGMGLFVKYINDVNVPKYFLGMEFIKHMDQLENLKFPHEEGQCRDWITYEEFISNK